METFLSICMIVKNEEKVIRRCLDSIVDIADEIIIVDTGSNDKTKEIAHLFTKNVLDFNWVDDFSKARNFAASKASGEWILVIDADEFVDRDSFKKFLNNLKENPPSENIMAVQIINFVGLNGKDTSLNYHERLYKNDGTIQYYRNIHELLKHKDSLENRGFSDLQIFHSGYMKNVVIEKEKSKRNLKLLKSKKEKEPIDYYFIGNEYDQLGQLDKAIKYYQRGFNLKDDINRDWVKKLLLRLVNSLHNAKRSKEALEVIESCEGIFHYLVDFKFYKGKIYFDLGDLEKSKLIFEEIISKHGELKADSSSDFLELLPHKILGEIYENQMELHSAVRSYTRALSINDSDDYIWMRLITLLSRHSRLEELIDFLNNNLLNKENMTPQRAIRILLSVPSVDVQRLTSSFVNETGLSTVEMEALKLKNLHLNGNNGEIVKILDGKSSNEIVLMLGHGIYSLYDFILMILELNNKKYEDLVKGISFDKPLGSLFDILFDGKVRKLSTFEQDFFVQIFKHARILRSDKTIKILLEKMGYLNANNRNYIKKELEKFKDNH